MRACIVAAILSLLSLPCAQRADAQGSIDASNLSQSGRTGSSSGRGATVQVGAGTTSGSTTGSSGPQSSASSPPGEIDPPALPAPSVCDRYAKTPAHRGCLWVVLRQDRDQERSR